MWQQLLGVLLMTLLLAGCSKPMRTITSNPSGAQIFVGNYALGTTPIVAPQPPPGQKCWPSETFTAKLEGYKTATSYSAGGCDSIFVDFALKPLTVIKRSITSSPDEATIYYGKDLKKFKKGVKQEIEVGATPFKDQRDDQNSDDYPKWEGGYYRAVLKGYRPLVIEVEETDSDLKLDFELAPLPRFPDPPKIVFPDPKEVIIQPVKLDDHREQLLNLPATTKFAIVPFKDPQGMGAGSLVADMLILHLKKQGYQVVDREVIDKVLKELDMMSSMKTNTDDKELAEKIGQIEKYDYLITGAINDYSAKSENVRISPVIPKEEGARYLAEYDEFVNYYNKEVEEKDRPSRFPATIQQWEMEYASKPRDQYLSMARIGLSAKMIKQESTKIVWIGLASTTDMSLQEGTKRVVDDMIRNFTTPQIQIGTGAPSPLAAEKRSAAPAEPASETRSTAPAEPASETRSTAPADQAEAKVARDSADKASAPAAAGDQGETKDSAASDHQGEGDGFSDEPEPVSSQQKD